MAFVAAIVMATGAVAQTAGWAADPDTGCWTWIDVPHAGGRTSWSGACVDGLAEGKDVLTTTTGNRYEGRLRAGRRAVVASTALACGFD